MSYECRHLRETFCNKRKKECDPGAPGCVLRGRFIFPFSESANTGSKSSRSRRTAKPSADSAKEP